MNLATRILTSRFLTHSGDQAWDFAVPLVLMRLLPGQLRVAALYYLLVRLCHFFIFPRFATLIDQRDRPRLIRIGLGMQLAGVALGTLCILHILDSFALAFAGLVLGGSLAALGSVFMDVFLNNDLVPSAFRAVDLTRINSRLRQMDLVTEVTIPVLAGFVLLVTISGLALFGFILIAAWNILSFIFEYFLLDSIFLAQPELKQKPFQILNFEKSSLWQRLSGGWRNFFAQPIALSLIAYSLIGLTVLSPHGMLMTGFLKDGWHMQESEIGIFRGLGAAFGLLATLSFSWVTKKFGLVKGTQTFLCFQALMVMTSVIFFLQIGSVSHFAFLACIVFSRIGLYGFALGETQIRQLGIVPEVRGQVNGFANALSNLPNLILYGAASLLPSTGDFVFFVIVSALAVTSAAVVFSYWSARQTVFARRKRVH